MVTVLLSESEAANHNIIVVNQDKAIHLKASATFLQKTRK